MYERIKWISTACSSDIPFLYTIISRSIVKTSLPVLGVLHELVRLDHHHEVCKSFASLTTLCRYLTHA
jgi:hypothetical protein